MPFGYVLLVDLSTEESELIRKLLSQDGLEIRAHEVEQIDDVKSLGLVEKPRLIIYRVDEEHRRADQEIHRIKRIFYQTTPLLLLIAPHLTRKLRAYLRAGADDYWVLPLDETSFPPRLHVLLEWKQSPYDENSVTYSEDYAPNSKPRSLWTSIADCICRSLRRYSSETTTQPELNPLIAAKWEKIRRLGFGSFGEVWLIRERGKNVLAVSKIPHTEKTNTKCVQEATILKRLADHPNAVKLIEVVKEQGRVILIQEYVEGTTLQELLDQGMEAAQKESTFLQLLDVVAYAHEHYIMHRDIKPDNILITHSGKLKLLDFGTAKDLTRRSISSTIIGSRPFMAPEQIMGKSRIASDVWALGVILYALATECLPFWDDNEKQLMDLILETNPQPPRYLEPDLPESLETIILNCLEKDYNRRYPDASELGMDLLEAFPDFGQGNVLPH